jgi:hypothetical protein
MSQILESLSKIYPQILEDPKFLGPNHEKLIEFWNLIEGLSVDEREEIFNNIREMENSVICGPNMNSACSSATKLVGEKIRNDAFAEVCDITGYNIFGFATIELMGNWIDEFYYSLIKFYNMDFQRRTLTVRITNNYVEKLTKLSRKNNLPKDEIVRLAIESYVSSLDSKSNAEISYSKTLQKFSDYLKKSNVLKNPAKYLGPNWEDVLYFWSYSESFNEHEKEEIYKRYCSLFRCVPDFYRKVSVENAIKVVGKKFRTYAYRAAWDIAEYWLFGYATDELIANIDNKVAYNMIMSHKKS